MNKLLTLGLLFVISQNLKASDICSRSSQDLRILLDQNSSRISFKNDGGLFNQGVCWWHNRMQRSSAYLVSYEPSLPAPTRPELLKILLSLRNMDSAVVIPGYEDFLTFSHDYQKEIQEILDGWQKLDGFFNFQWIRGISGQSELPSEQMLARMRDVYTYYKYAPAPMWIMAQIKGMTSHSFLVLRMREIANGYEMELIDSNHPQETMKLAYYEGDTALRVEGGKYTFVPYVGFQNDYKKIREALRLRCGDKNISIDLSHLKEGQIEL